MKMTFRVDQKAALAQGIDAPSSTVVLDVEPGELSEQQRQVLAAVLYEGHDCTRLGIQTTAGELSGQHWYKSGDRFCTYNNGSPTDPLLLVRPDLAGLADAIERLLAERVAAIDTAEKLAVEKAEWRAEALEKAVALVTDDLSLLVYPIRGTGCAGDGNLHSTTVDGESFEIDDFSESIQDAVRAVQATVQADIEQRAVVKEAEKEAAAKAAEEQKAEEKAEYDVLYARLEFSLRDRDQAGFSQPKEVEREMRKLIRADAGYPADNDMKFSETEDLHHLTDSEFAALTVAKKAAPEDADVEPLEGWTSGGNYRPATEDDDEDDVDVDNEVYVKRQGVERFIRVQWRRGGLLTVANVAFG